MSRRESRSSLGVRQNDALFEFENFKKKFLLANKHITKLNSTLSVRIEELNAQISTLYVENLRLRASEIALAAQLKREREKSHQILADAESASQNLAKHLSYLRDSYNIRPAPNMPSSPPSPRARRREPSVNSETGSPLANRVSRPPNIPGIYEEEEPYPSSNEQEKPPAALTPSRKRAKSKPRLSASKLPLPSRGASPTRSATPMVGYENISAGPLTKPRKTLRRPSGLLEINTEALSAPRSASPAFGSPIRLEAGRAEEAEEYAAVHGEIEVVIMDQDPEEDMFLKKEKRKGKSKEQRESGSEKDAVGDLRVREKKKQRDEVEPSDFVKPKPKDSTRTALQPIDSNVHDATDTDAATTSKRQFLRPSSPIGSAPTSRGSSSPAPPDGDGMGVGGNRERRTRKSVNYAEPKLNTKMRKPDPPPGTAEPTRKKRSSAAAVMSSTNYKPVSSSSSPPTADNDVDSQPQFPLDLPPTHIIPALPLRGANGYINPENFPLPPSRPGSAAAMYSPGPPTRTTGSTTSGTSTSSSSSSSLLKKKKSRPLLSDDDSDGAQADAEYMGGGGGASPAGSWVNMEGRRKGLPKRSAAAAAVAAIEDIRRHSMAI